MQDHGGNRREARAAYGLTQLLDFSASINPLGHPEGLREHVNERWDEVLHYPERGAPEVTAALAQHYRVPVEGVLVGSGSAEPIDLALRTLEPGRLVLCPPDFGLYEELAPPGVPVERVPRLAARGFALDVAALADTVAPRDLVLFSNPGNPCGLAAARDQVLSLLDRCASVGATLAVDEAFADFCPPHSVLAEAGRHPNLLVFRSLTKFFGIPGLRLGFAVAPPPVRAMLASRQVPWSVSAPAQEAGLYCLSRTGDWTARTLACVGEARAGLAKGLAGVPGLRPLPSDANYLLVETGPPAPSAQGIYEALARRGILIRHCGSFGLGDGYFRVAVRTREENEVLVEALHEQTLSPRG